MLEVNISCDPFTGENVTRRDKKRSMIPIHPDLYNSRNFVFRQNKGFCRPHLMNYISDIHYHRQSFFSTHHETVGIIALSESRTR